LLKFESDLVCDPCRLGKMIATLHSPVNTMMIEQLGHLLHMYTVGPSRVRSTRGKWYVLVIVYDYSRYSWVFFLESKDEVFEHFQSLALRLNNEHPNCLKAIHSDNVTEFRMPLLMSFALSMGLISSFPPRVFLNRMESWNERTAYYISNWIFLRSILHLIPFELLFGCKPSVSHFRPFGCKCFVMKCGNLDKYESRSFDGILLGYTPRGRSYRVYNVETNIVVESCDVTFDETAPCPCGVLECASDKEMEERVFVDEGLQGIDGDEDEPLPPSTSSPEPVPTSTLEAEAPQATTSSTAAVEGSRVEGEIVSELGAPSHIQKVHAPQ
jgi:hypothetical protein